VKRLEVDPFGKVSERPKCPYCGRPMGWWAVANMAHMRNCKDTHDLQDELAKRQGGQEDE
jgi:hypothetical protein